MCLNPIVLPCGIIERLLNYTLENCKDFKFALCVPTLNAGKTAALLLRSVAQQKCQPSEVLIVDSDSDDASVELFRAIGARIVVISRTEFNHGRTRQLAVEMLPDNDVIVFLTHDAILAGNDDLERILAYFRDEKVGAAYGRQLPRLGAGEIEAHARLYNYPVHSRVRSAFDIPELGIKTAFFSNSFAAYRRSALQAVGGFPCNVILGEDAYVAGRMLLQGWKVAYCAEAQVFHSHDYSLWEEFRRYFDIGVFHGRESWLRCEFGQPGGEGVRFIRSELAYLRKTRPSLIPAALARNALKLFSYRLGLLERHMPLWLKRRLSLHANYWNEDC